MSSTPSSAYAGLPTAQPTTWQQATGCDRERAALIVVDVLGGSQPIAPPLQEMANNAVRLVKAAREAGVPVIFVCDQHIPGTDREMELWGEHCLRGTEDSIPLDAFEVQENDYLIPKRRYSGFNSTDLDILLRELGREELIVVGFDTNICVHHTLADAFALGYRTIVPAEATATTLVGTQADGLAYFTRVFDTRVTTTETVLTDLRG